MEGDIGLIKAYEWIDISIHALRVEGDTAQLTHQSRKSHYFYPRPPGGGRPNLTNSEVNFIYISIHALRVEGDL